MTEHMKRLVQTIITQGIIITLSILTGFIMPAKMGSIQFGYWSLYLFYVAYLNLISLGYSDGYTLINAGSSDKSLQTPKHRTAFAILVASLIIISLLCVFIVQAGIFSDVQRVIIFTVLAINIPIVCIQSILLSILLAGNRSVAYNNINLVLKAISTLSVFALFGFGKSTFFPIIVADSFSRLLMTLMCVVLCRHHIWGPFAKIKVGLYDIREKCLAGMQVTLSYVLASVMPLTGRLILEHRHEMEIYGEYSFAMTLLSIIISFTSTIGVIIFPMMKTINTEILKSRFNLYRYLIDLIISFALVVYVFIQFILSNFEMMKQYQSILQYVGLILAMSLPIAKIQLILTPFYKTLRLEKVFLLWNAVGFIGTLALCWLSFNVYASPFSLAFSSLLSMLVWSYAVERYLRNLCNLKFDLRHELQTIALLLVFIFASMRSTIMWFLILYIPSLLTYTFLEWGNLKPLMANLRESHS